MTIDISPSKIKEVRDRTGVGMGKCKEALEAVKGDVEEAIAWLRKQGMAAAVKKQGREAKEGVIVTAEDAHHIALVEVNAETDFVVNNDRFKAFAANMAQEALSEKPASLEAFMAAKNSKEKGLTNDEVRATVVQAIGENIQVRRVLVLAKDQTKSLGVYSHQGGKLITVVEIVGSPNVADLARDIAMHTAAATPDYVSPETVPAEIIEKEKEISRGQLAGKPAAMLDKIIEGKLNAFYDQICLIRQKFIRDDTITIADLVALKGKEQGKTLAVKSFIRWSVGQ